VNVSITTPRYAVEYRRPGERRWQTIVTVGSSEVATQAMFDLMGGRSGDWRISQTPGTCMELPGAGESG